MMMKVNKGERKIFCDVCYKRASWYSSGHGSKNAVCPEDMRILLKFLKHWEGEMYETILGW
jgi:hypothetical protein